MYVQDAIGEVILSDDLPEFDTNVDEVEAVGDLEDLILSDDELFVDLSTNSECSELESGELVEAQPNAASNSRSQYTCQKCSKVYKRKQFFDKHTVSCTGKSRKRLTTPKAVTKKRSASNAGEA